MTRIDRTAYLILLFGFVVKLVLGVSLPLSPDEAYYWMWSHHLQLSYFDHPPFVSWLFLIAQPLENWGSWVRLPGLVMGHATIFLWALLLRSFLSSKQLQLFLILAMLMPLVGPGGLIVTPDIPFMFFWVLTLLLTELLVRTAHTPFAFFAGLSLGFGFSSKYTMVLILPILLFWIFHSRKHDADKLFKWIGLGVLGAVLGSSPVWIWNLQNDLQSFSFQLNHGFGSGFRPKYVLDYFLAQAGLIFPTILWAAWKARGQTPIWLQLCALVPLVFFAGSSFFAYAEVNWPIASHPAVLAMATLAISQSAARWTAGIWLSALLVVASEAYLDWIPKDRLRLKTDTLHAYDNVAEATRDLDLVFYRTYQMASAVSFENKKFAYKLRGMNRTDFFDFLPQSIPTSREFYLVLKTGERLPRKLKDKYEILKVEPIDTEYNLALMRGLK